MGLERKLIATGVEDLHAETREHVLAMGVMKNCIPVAVQLIGNRHGLSCEPRAAPVGEGSNTSKS